MATAKVAAEVCEQEFTRFVEAMGLDVDQSGMDDDDKKSFVAAKRRLIGAMATGNLIIDDQGRATYQPAVGDTNPITFYSPTGATLMAMDQKKSGHDVAKMFAFMSDMTKEPTTRFAAMDNRDLKICQAITVLFLG